MSSDESGIRTLLAQLARSPFTFFDGSGAGAHVRVRRKANGVKGVKASGEGAADALYAGEEKPANCLFSPRVGHFFPRLNEDGSKFFVEKAPIKEGDVYGIIEAMHLRYECKAERTGTIAKWLVDMGDAVEFGQALVVLAEE